MSTELLRQHPTPIEQELYQAVYMVHDPEIQIEMSVEEHRTIRHKAVVDLDDFARIMSNSVWNSVGRIPSDFEMKSLADTIKRGMRFGYLAGKLETMHG